MSDPSASTSSEWHTIRPWTPHLTLAVREITSVSATFILSSSLDGRLFADDEPELAFARDHNDVVLDPRGVIADAISQGLSVDVNGSNWKRVFFRTNEQADEAIIFIYGLHPGRQYDIDLALVSGGMIRKQVTTEDVECTTPDTERSDDHHFIAPQESLSSSTSNTNESLPSIPNSHSPAPEERLRTLTHQLNVLQAEQASLQASLKSSKRDANKVTTSLRSDIDGLKRASEKAGVAEGKARQRVRALEDAVRRANESREHIEQLTVVDEQDLPGLQEKQSEAEDVLKEVTTEADAVREERDKREEEVRKRKESVKGECATLNQRLERLTGKKEKLENTVILDLEAQLAEIQREIDVAERGGFQNGDAWEALYEDPSRTDTQRRRLSHPGTIGRPLAQRSCPPPISPPHFSRHQPRSQSVYRAGNDFSPGLAHPTSGHLHLVPSSISHPGPSGFTQTTTPALSHSTNSIFSQSTSSSLSRSTSSVSSSTLSSKAPPFEPTRSFRVSLSSSGSSGIYAANGSQLPMSSQGMGSSSSFSLSSGQVKAGKSSGSRGSSGEDGWAPSNA